MKAFLDAGGEKQKGATALRAEKRKAKEAGGKKAKDPNAPKKPAGGAYGQYLAEKRPEFIEKCKGKPITEVSKMAGAAWKKLTDAQKAPYEAKYAKAKAAYEKAMASYKPPAGEEAEDEEEEAEEEEEEEEKAKPKKKARQAKK